MRRKRLIIGALLLLVAIMVIAGANTARNAVRWQPFTQTPQQLHDLLSPYWRLTLPEGPGPHKAAILMSGCDGVHDNMDFWAQHFVAMGRAALIVDSHHPRLLDKNQAWRAVCAAQVLPGAERAGDIAVAMAALQARDDIDTSDLALLGASHGGWSTMELMQLLQQDAPPPGLTEWPAPRVQLEAMIGPITLLYPYCGLVSRGGEALWPHHAKGLMILGSEDSITDSEKCLEMARDLQTRGANLIIEVIKGADHGFDQHDRSILSPLKFNQYFTDLATGAFIRFMQGFA